LKSLDLIFNCQVEDFIDQRLSGTIFQKCSHFIYDNKVKFYLCVQKENINGELIDTMTVDSFVVVNEKYLGTGNMNPLLDKLEAIADVHNLPIKIGCLINKRLKRYFKRRGYLINKLDNAFKYKKGLS